MSENPLRQLYDYGQSFWFDSLSREMIVNGDLKRMVEDDGLRGITSNPTIFHSPVSSSDLYDETIAREARRGKSSEEIFYVIAQEDIRAACDLLRRVYDDSQRTDGFVSLEESPHIAHDTEASIREGHRLRELVDRPNLFVKVPATPEGIPAVKELLTDGVNVNITLMFAQENYAAVAEAYLSAMEERQRRGLPLDTVASVASMFVSRIDTKVDGWIDNIVEQEPDAGRREAVKSLRGKLAIANARLCYQHYHKFFGSGRFLKLAQDGARPQRVLFASTSTKDPSYPDTYYVNALIGFDTVVTMAPATVPAFRGHGKAAFTIEEGVNEAREAFSKAEELGIDLDRAMQELQDEGVDRFAESFDALVEAIEEKRRQFLLVTSR
jgi:transaldolase / glucose-6-phosphate isomerase